MQSETGEGYFAFFSPVIYCILWWVGKITENGEQKD